MNNDGNKILDAIKKMAADDNKGLRMSTTIVDVKDDPRGSIVGFGTEKAGQIPNINDNNAIYVSRDIRRSSSCLSPESGTFYALLPCRQ